MRWAVNVERKGEMRNSYKNFVVKPERNRTLGRPRRRREDNTGMDVHEIVCEVVDWIHLAKERDEW
jgi:hypothetical protein